MVSVDDFFSKHISKDTLVFFSYDMFYTFFQSTGAKLNIKISKTLCFFLTWRIGNFGQSCVGASLKHSIVFYNFQIHGQIMKKRKNNNWISYSLSISLNVSFPRMQRAFYLQNKSFDKKNCVRREKKQSLTICKNLKIHTKQIQQNKLWLEKKEAKK